MASSVDKELEKNVQCGICLKRFEDPKLLICQHSYCKKCLERLVTSGNITCPECKRKTEVPSGDVKSLPFNFLINNILSVRCYDQTSARTLCEKHEGKALKLFCKICDQLICRKCTAIYHHHLLETPKLEERLPKEQRNN